MFTIFKTIGHGFVSALIALHIIAAPVPAPTIVPTAVIQPQAVQVEKSKELFPTSSAKPPAVTPSSKGTQETSPEKQRESLVTMKTAFDEMIRHLDSTSIPAREHSVASKLYMHQAISAADTSGLPQDFLRLIQDPTFSGNPYAIEYYLKILANEQIDTHNGAIKLTEQKLCDTNPELSESNISFCHSLFADDLKQKAAITVSAPSYITNPPQPAIQPIKTINCTSNNSVLGQVNTDCWSY